MMENQPGRLRVAIVGAGGVGGLVGALLSRKGDGVTFVGTESTATVLTKQGVCVRSERYGSFTVSANAVTMLTTPVDVCVVAVKAMQLEAAMGRVPGDRLADALVVPFLNGVEHVGTLRARYGSRVLPATMRVASTPVAPGVIEHTSPFMKVELASSDGLLAVIEEIAHIGEKLGAVLNADAAVQFFDSVPAAMQSSMQHDAAAGRTIEIEAIGGAVLRAAAQTGIAAPVTERLVEGLRQTASR